MSSCRGPELPFRRPGLFVLLALGVAAVVSAVASATSLTVAPVKANAFRVCALSGYPGTSTAALDTYANEGNKTKNYGNDTAIFIWGKSTKLKIVYVRFDLSKCSPALTGTAVIKQATLRLFLQTTASANRTYGAYRVDGASCPEGLSTCWGETSMTWNSRPSSASTATATLTINTGAANNKQLYAWNVTADVVKFVAGTAANYGWSIADTAADTGTVDSKWSTVETAVATEAPRLVIVYSP